MSARQATRLTLLILVIAALSHTGLWFFATGLLLRSIPRQTELAAADGWQIGFGAPRRAGWPFSAAVEMPDFVASRPLGGTGIQLRLSRLTARLRPGAPRTLRLEPEGEALLTLGPRTFRLQATAARLLVAGGGGPALLSAQGVILRDPGLVLLAQQVEARLTPSIVDGQISGLAPDPPPPPPFDQGATLSLRARILPPFPLAPTPRDSAAAWQAENGQVVLDAARLDWGPLHAEASGQGGLDPALQPLASLSLVLRGADPALRALGDAGLLAPAPLTALRGALSLLTLAGPGGAPLRLPLDAGGGLMRAAGIPLLRLPTFSWGP